MAELQGSKVHLLLPLTSIQERYSLELTMKLPGKLSLPCVGPWKTLPPKKMTRMDMEEPGAGTGSPWGSQLLSSIQYTLSTVLHGWAPTQSGVSGSTMVTQDSGCTQTQLASLPSSQRTVWRLWDTALCWPPQKGLKGVLMWVLLSWILSVLSVLTM